MVGVCHIAIVVARGAGVNAREWRPGAPLAACGPMVVMLT